MWWYGHSTVMWTNVPREVFNLVMWYQGFHFMSLGRKFVWPTCNKYERHTLGEANCGPTCSKAISPRTVSTQLRRGKRWEGMVPKTAQPRLLDTSLSFYIVILPWDLHHSSYIVLWLRDQIAKFKIRRFWKLHVWSSLAKVRLINPLTDLSNWQSWCGMSWSFSAVHLVTMSNWRVGTELSG